MIVFTSLQLQLFIYRPYYIFIQCILILFNNSNQWYCKSPQTPFSSSSTYRSMHQQKKNAPSCRLDDPGLHDCKDKIDNSHRSNTHLRKLLDWNQFIHSSIVFHLNHKPKYTTQINKPKYLYNEIVIISLWLQYKHCLKTFVILCYQ